MRRFRPELLLLWLLGSALFYRCISFGYTWLDEQALILANLDFLRDPSNIPAAFVRDVFQSVSSPAAYFRPFLTLSLMADAQVSAADAWMYHLTNILLHLGCVSVFWAVLRKTGSDRWMAFLVSALFLVHPAVTQTVAWIPGRNDSLLALFVLGSFYCWLEGWTAAHLVLFLFALFTKETAVVLPLVIGACALTRDRLMTPSKTGLSLRWLAGTGCAIVLWAVLRHSALSSRPLGLSTEALFLSVWRNSPAMLLYLGKAFLPVNLSVLPVLADSNLWYGAGIASALTAIAVWQRKWVRGHLDVVVLGTAWFLLFLAPSLVRPDPDAIADFIEHRMYLPLIGILLVVAAVIRSLHAAGYGRSVRAFLLTLIPILAATTYLHEENFRDDLSFWRNAARSSPHSPLAQRNLGAMYYLRGDLDGAEPLFRKSLELNPGEAMAHNNLGLIFMARGQETLAEAEFKAELSRYPRYDDGHFNLGLLYGRLGRMDEAAAEFRKTLEINPAHPKARELLDRIAPQ